MAPAGWIGYSGILKCTSSDLTWHELSNKLEFEWPLPANSRRLFLTEKQGISDE